MSTSTKHSHKKKHVSASKKKQHVHRDSSPCHSKNHGDGVDAPNDKLEEKSRLLQLMNHTYTQQLDHHSKQDEIRHAQDAARQQQELQQYEAVYNEHMNDAKYIDEAQTLFRTLSTKQRSHEMLHDYLNALSIINVYDEAALYTNMVNLVEFPNNLNHVTQYNQHISSDELLTMSLEYIDYSHQIIRELSNKLLANSIESHHVADRDKAENHIYMIRKLLELKLQKSIISYLNHVDFAEIDSSSHHKPNSEAAPSTSMFQITQSNAHVQFGLFIRPSAITRVKSINFQFSHSSSITIELPVLLQRGRIALSLIHYPHDSCHVSASLPMPPFTQYVLQHDMVYLSNVNHYSFAEKCHRTVQALNELSTVPLPTLEDETSTQAMMRLVSQSVRSVHVHYVAIGGVYSFHQFLLPPPPRTYRGMAFRESSSLEQRLVHVPYPSTKDHAGPLRITLTLPDEVASGTPKFAQWDACIPNSDGTYGNWVLDTIDIIEYDEVSKRIQLSVERILPFAIVQPRALDFPYRSWSLSPTPSHVEYQLLSSRFPILLHATHQGVAYKAHDSLQKQSDANDQFMHVGQFAISMANKGINIAPSEHDALYCRKPGKSSDLLHSLHAHISSVISLFHLKSSRHSSFLPAEQCCFQVALCDESVLMPVVNRSEIREWIIHDKQAEERGDEIVDFKVPSQWREDDNQQFTNNTPLTLQKQESNSNNSASAFVTVLVKLLPLPANSPTCQPLLSFQLIKGDDALGQFDTTPLAQQRSHASLRRTLFEYFKNFTKLDLASAMGFRHDLDGNEVKTELMYGYEDDEATIVKQINIQKLLNVTQPFVFH